MQTIKVSIEPTANGYEFCNGNTAVARITNNGYGTPYNRTLKRKPRTVAAVEVLKVER